MRTLSTLFALSLLAACGGSEAPATPEPAKVEPVAEPAKVEPVVEAAAPAVAGDVTKGQATYSTICIACHQADGTGMGGALGADFVNDKTRLAKSDEVLLNSIANGVEGTAMIAWSAQLDETQRRDVLAYIRATFGAK